MPGKWCYISWSDGDPSGPVDPGYGHGGNYPSTGPVYPGRPVDPGYGRPSWNPVDPGYGHGGSGLHPGGGPIYLPVFPFDPTKPVDPDTKPPSPDVKPPDIGIGSKFLLKWIACIGWALVHTGDAEPK